MRPHSCDPSRKAEAGRLLRVRVNLGYIWCVLGYLVCSMRPCLSPHPPKPKSKNEAQSHSISRIDLNLRTVGRKTGKPQTHWCWRPTWLPGFG